MTIDDTHEKTAADLGAPLSLDRGPDWSNRFALAPLTNEQSNIDGTLSDDEYAWLVSRARGGFGLTMTCATYVHPSGRAWLGQLGIADDYHLDGLTRVADGIREAGSTSAVQLHHGGRRCDPALHGGPNLSAFADTKTRTRALTTAEVYDVVEWFGQAAARAERAGFDGVQLHGAHGYLLGQFLDAGRNERTDEYGGSFENRSRIVWQVIERVRELTGPDFQLGVRLTPEGRGIPLAEAQELAQALMTSGSIDHLDMSLWDAFETPREDDFEGAADDENLLIDRFTGLSRGSCRLGVAGKILTGADARWCLGRGADFVTIGTAGIIHQDFPASVLADPEFTSVPQPVTREHLRGQNVGEKFVDYLATRWDDFVI